MTEQAKHTAGPWMRAASPSSVVGWPVVGPMGRSICNLSWFGVKPEHVTDAEFAAFRAEVEANGHLIAASPDLFDALKAILSTSGQAVHGRPTAAQWEAGLRAIAKAEGRLT